VDNFSNLMTVIINTITTFLQTHKSELIWILLLFFIGKIVLAQIARGLRRFVDDHDAETNTENEKRMDTLGDIIKKTGNVIIWLIILMMTLNIFGVNIGPLLASAGILGVAISFGSQSLVKDFMSGLFIILENQYGLGDKVEINGSEGSVHKITMRSTVLTTKKGDLVYIPNGLIKSVTNYSQKR